ncbi:hypothetical protein [Hyphomonas sp.]|uniref:hypothetical protein n=1 Tax=Hyphomonas sp. TaxID=87 RepID=UPI0039194573
MLGRPEILSLFPAMPVEADWVQHVLSPLRIRLLPKGAEIPVYPGAIYLFASVLRMNLDPAFLARVRQAGGCGLIHIGDEYYRGDFAAYAAFDFVFRMMPFEGVESPGVFPLPLGVTSDFGPECRTPPGARELSWMFAGDWKADRHVMARAFRDVPGGLLSLPKSYKGEAGISRAEYKAAMSNAVFAPCPSGNVCIETFRPYEALHLGAIPLIPKRRLSDPYGLLLGPHPLPSFEDWRGAAKFVAEMWATPAALDRLQAECLEWWDAFRPELSRRAAAFIDEGRKGAFREILASQFGKGVGRAARLKGLLVQQNADQTFARAGFHLRRLAHKVTTGKTLSGRWSISEPEANSSSGPGKQD